MDKIELTTKQKNLIYDYVEKWRNIAFHTRQTNKQELEGIIGFIYGVLGYKKPLIIFKTNPIDAILHLFYEHPEIFDSQIRTRTKNQKIKHLWGNIEVSNIKNKLVHPVTSWFIYNESWNLPSDIHNEMISPLKNYVNNYSATINRELTRLSWSDENIKEFQYWLWLEQGVIKTESWAYIGAIGDFYANVLGGYHHPLKWKALINLITKCGWVFPFQEMCVVCQRPSKIRHKLSGFLDGGEKPIIEFSDGYQIYKNRIF